MAAQLSVYGFRSNTSIGFPCPKNTAGITWGIGLLLFQPWIPAAA
jgi:hypothetical protein